MKIENIDKRLAWMGKGAFLAGLGIEATRSLSQLFVKSTEMVPMSITAFFATVAAAGITKIYQAIKNDPKL